MSKKHFIALADVIKRFNASSDTPFNQEQIRALGAFCQAQNSAFKAKRWLDYIAGECGPSGGEIKALKTLEHAAEWLSNQKQ